MLNLKNVGGFVNTNQSVVSSNAVSSNTGNTVKYGSVVVNNSNKNSTLELQYAMLLKQLGTYRKRIEGENTTLYKWVVTNWVRVVEDEALADIWQWLKSTSQSVAKHSKAVSIYKSCMLELEELGPLPKESLIPLINCWLIVTPDNKLKIQKPDPAYGVTYHIKANLDFQEGAEFYEPKPLPENSLIGNFAKLSLPDILERALVQEFSGFTLLNDTRFQKAQVWVGNGGNGKSVLLKVLSELHARVGSLCLDRLSGFAMTPVVDSSLLLSAETPKRGINEQELKKIVTGDPVTVEYKCKDQFTYRPRGKLLIACNTFPQLNDDTDGIWRRLQIVRWGAKITQDQEIMNLDERIINEELHLVVDWCLEGLLRLLNRGRFDEPASVIARKEAEKQNCDSVKVFIEDYGIAISTTETIAKDQLYDKYAEFCEKNCLFAATGPMFWKGLRGQFAGLVETKKGTNGRRYRVVNLTTSKMVDDCDVTPFDDMEGGAQ